MKYIFFLLTSAFILQGCSTQAEKVHVGRYESIPWGFDTNSWWIEGPDGVVLINTQFLPSATKELVDIAESYTGKKVVLAFVLHANPDKFNGTQYLRSQGIRVVTSEQVRNRIPQVDKLRRSWFYDRYKPDYPEKLVLPDSIGATSTTVKAAGLEFHVHIMGPSVSKDHIIVQVNKHIFVGDIIANKHHSWLELGLINEWQSTLEYIKNLEPHYVYPGRGYAAGKDIIHKQAAYLNHIQNVVIKISRQGDYNEARKQLVVQEVESLYPGYGNSFFLNSGVKPVWDTVKTSRH